MIVFTDSEILFDAITKKVKTEVYSFLGEVFRINNGFTSKILTNIYLNLRSVMVLDLCGCSFGDVFLET